MNNFYVYTWTRPDTGEVFYVGKGRVAEILSPRSTTDTSCISLPNLSEMGFPQQSIESLKT